MRKIDRLLLLAILLLSFPLQAAIVGTIINSDGQPVAGAWVFIFTPETTDARRMRLQSKTTERTPVATVQSDSRGNFTFESPKEPVVDLRVEAKGFAPDALRVLNNEDVGALALISAPTLKGTVTANGKPVAGAAVLWAGSAEYLTTTDADGHYSAPDPSKWANRIIIIHPDYAIFDEGIGPNEKKGPDRVLDRGITLTGRVLSAEGLTPVAKAAIFVDSWQLATSGDDGAFSVAHVRKDWTQVEARMADRAAVRARTATESITLRLAKAASVNGTVLDSKTQLPVPGAEVRLTSGMLGQMSIFSRMSITDGKGRFAITPIAVGTYQISANYPSASIIGSSVPVTAGQTVQKSLYLTQRGRVTGNVMDEDKRPVAGARVAWRTSTREPMMMMMMGPRNMGATNAFSAPDGRFVLRSVETDADLRLDAAKKGFPAGHSGGLRIAPGERKSGVIISIPRGIALSGRVTDHNGKPLSGVAVDAAEASSEGPQMMMRRMAISNARERSDDVIRTASDGTFTIRLKEGTYDVNFKSEGFAAKSMRGIAVGASPKPLEVTLDPGVEVSGRVTRGGAGVEGVNVGIMSPDGFNGTTTLPDGSFRIQDLTPGQAMLSVNKMDAFVQQVRPVTIPSRDIAIELPAGGRISGHVIDKATRKPITSFNAGVTTSRSAGGMMIMMPPMMRTFTSDDGSFTLENVPPGQTQVVVNAAGYTTARLPGLTVEDGKAINDVEIAAESGVKLTGHVTGPDGSPLAGVSVRLDSNVNGGRVMRFDSAETSAVTDPNGDYTIDTLEKGERTFSFQRQGLVTEQRTVELSSDKTTLNVQLSAGTRATGVVVTDGGVPVPDALVRAMSAGDSGREARSDANGNFQLEGLSAGHYTITAAKSGYANAIMRDVDVTTGAPIRIAMSGGGTIAGHVNGLTEKDLRDAVVTAQGSNGNASSPVDASGNFHIEGAPVGTVRVSARVGQGFGGSMKISAAKTVQVDAGSSVQVDIEFKTTTVIRGRVTRNGQALSSAMVSFIPKGGRAQTLVNGTTDSTGGYEVSGLDDATYTVQVADLQRMAPFMTSYDVHGSGTFDIDIKASPVRGRVTDATSGAVISDAHIELRAPQPEAMLSARAAQTGPSGSFSIDDVGRGTYQAMATKEGYGHQTLSLTVGDTAPDPLDFKLSPTTGVTLRVVDGRDNRLLSANVRVVDGQGREVPLGDNFRFGGTAEPMKLTLAPGSYRITVSAMSYASRTVTVSSPSDQTVALTPGGALVLQSRGSTSVRARLVDATSGVAYIPSNRGPFASALLTIEPRPASTTLQNVAPGRYRLEVLDAADQVVNSVDILVVEGQQASYAI